MARKRSLLGAFISGLISGAKGKPSYKKALSHTGRKRKRAMYWYIDSLDAIQVNASI